MVLTRHDSHARLAAEVLRAGLAVFVEKPVGLSELELDEVADAWMASGRPAMAGFNRRFARAIQDLKAELGHRSPIQVTYRVFAGSLPSSHWSTDPANGGRLLGEVCHFVDTAGFLIGAPPVSVRAVDADGGVGPLRAQNVTAWIEYADGSTASIVYGGRTPPGAPKESIEAAADGLAARLDDFNTLRIWDGKTRTRRYRGTPKGHREEMEELIRVVRGEPSATADFAGALRSSLTTVCLARSMSSGSAVDVTTEHAALRSALSLETADRTFVAAKGIP
jgi:predicted dehydrogenase